MNTTVDNPSKPHNQTIDLVALSLMFLTFLTSSWDTVAVFELYGTWRISLFFMLPFVLVAPYYWIKNPKNALWNMLILLASINLFSTLLNDFHLRGLIYAGWFFFFVGFVVSFSAFFAQRHLHNQLLQLFLFAALLNMLLGIAQFIAGFWGIHLGAAQRLWPWGINRASGFTFEPSYYVTYAMFFWVASLVLVENAKKLSNICPPWLTWGLLITSTLGLLLATSRMGWLFMALIAIPYPVRLLVRMARKQRIPPFLWLTNSIIAIGIFAIASWVAVDFETFRPLFLNAGLFGYSSSNADVRIQAIVDTIAVFKANWLVGVGYGELPYEILLNLFNEIDENIVQDYLGASPYFEIAAATGIAGLSIFTTFLVYLLLVPMLKSKGIERLLILAFSLGFVAEFTVLQLNQNIFRVYIWLSIAYLVYLATYKDVDPEENIR